MKMARPSKYFEVNCEIVDVYRGSENVITLTVEVELPPGGGGIFPLRVGPAVLRQLRRWNSVSEEKKD